MKLKFFFTFISVLFLHTCPANMASPYYGERNSSGSAISSRDIDIIHEKIDFKLNPSCDKGTFTIEYKIFSHTSGKQIPLLFYAIDYENDFKIWLDNQEIHLLQVPVEIQNTKNSLFEKFSDSFKPDQQNKEQDQIFIKFRYSSKSDYKLNELKYFEVDLSRGEHTIRLQYTAEARVDGSDWVRTYSYEYSLSPARFWKSFGSLNISTNATFVDGTLETDLGTPIAGKSDSIARWHFDSLPADYYRIIYVPHVNSLAKILIQLDPFGVAIIVFILSVLLHLYLMVIFRKKYPEKMFSKTVIIGSLAVPFLLFFSYITSTFLIHGLLGKNTGTRGLYAFFTILYYPVILVAYFVIMMIIDWIIKRAVKRTE